MDSATVYSAKFFFSFKENVERVKVHFSLHSTSLKPQSFGETPFLNQKLGSHHAKYSSILPTTILSVVRGWIWPYYPIAPDIRFHDMLVKRTFWPDWLRHLEIPKPDFIAMGTVIAEVRCSGQMLLWWTKRLINKPFVFFFLCALKESSL